MTRSACLAAAVLLTAACDSSRSPTEPSFVAAAAANPAPRVVRTSGGPPFFTIAGNGAFVPHDGEWAALPFVRDPECPQAIASANLLSLDFAAFGCALTVEGFDRWENGPAVDPAPRQTHYSADGPVPIAFVRWSELQVAIADDVLTMAELLALPSLMWADADVYRETDIYGVSGPLGPGRGMYKITARGALRETGAAFRLHVNEVLGELQVVEIRFDG